MKVALRRRMALVAVVALALGISGVARAADHTVTNGSVTSVGGTKIFYSLFKPEGASAENQVPMIMHSHGWAGSRTTSVASFAAWLDAGFGVLSFDQRGFGESEGEANVEDPDLEGQDVKLLIDTIAAQDWVRHDVDGNGDPIANDPVLGAIGGSYGGGYQTIGALTEIRDSGRTRFNALAPEITWHDLPESLAPQGVVRTVWVAALYAVGASSVPQFIHESFVVGSATGTFPDGTVPGTTDVKDIFYRHSPKWFSDRGMKLNIPVLIGQGITDNLFNLNQGLHNFLDVVTPEAQQKSLFVGYNGGHVLPEAFPQSTGPSGDSCSGGFAGLSRSFYARVFADGDPSDLQPARFNLSVEPGKCLRVSSVDNYRRIAVEPGVIATNTTAGAPVAYELAKGPIDVAGIPKLSGTFTAAGVEARAFFALSVGTSPADAKVIQNNMMPLRSMLPAVQQPFSIELPGIAAMIPAGQNLYLTVSPISAISAGHTSRTPGAIVIQDPVVDVPVAA